MTLASTAAAMICDTMGDRSPTDPIGDAAFSRRTGAGAAIVDHSKVFGYWPRMHSILSYVDPEQLDASYA